MSFRLSTPVLIACDNITPDSKVHGIIMGPTWVLSALNGPHVGPMNLAIRDCKCHGVQIPSIMHNSRFWLLSNLNLNLKLDIVHLLCPQASLLVFVVYIFTVGNGVLPADVAFVSLSLLNVMSLPIIFIPDGVQSLAQVGELTEISIYIYLLI